MRQISYPGECRMARKQRTSATETNDCFWLGMSTEEITVVSDAASVVMIRLGDKVQGMILVYSVVAVERSAGVASRRRSKLRRAAKTRELLMLLLLAAGLALEKAFDLACCGLSTGAGTSWRCRVGVRVRRGGIKRRLLMMKPTICLTISSVSRTTTSAHLSPPAWVA